MLKTISMAAAPVLICATIARAECSDPQTQSEMNYCAAQDFATADRKLNEVYRKAMSSRDRKGKRALQQAQRAWITYRDLACKSYSLLADGGSMQPMLASLCLAKLSTERTQMLEEEAYGQDQ
jgi:uncharacterized protein YecT (DUF1311 family)